MWILGREAFENFKKANRQLRELTLKTAEEECGKEYDHYQPWMSGYGHRKTLSDLQVVDSKDGFVLNSSDVEFLGKIFSSDQSRYFSQIFPQNDTWRVMNPHSSEFERYISEIRNSYEFIQKYSPVTSMYLAESICHVVPLESASSEKSLRRDGSGFSTQLYRGGIFLSLAERSPVSAFENLLNLVHEMGHQILDVYLNSDFLIEEEDFQKTIYSVVRRTGRPAIMSIHALMASAQMLQFLNEAMPKLKEWVPEKYLTDRYLQMRDDVQLGLGLMQSIRLSPLGRGIVEDILMESHREAI
tara:strand:+ start:4891 stop:5790 length:900 start_codon:yes stop_codon:yes gene_type:complete